MGASVLADRRTSVPNEADPRHKLAEEPGSGGGGIPFAPTLTLPKGGGAIHGIGEKFSANAATGTGSITVPIATSPGRMGFQPELLLNYDSGAGNGPFGLGWSLSTRSISRKTDKGLPRYRDQDFSDIFLFTGAEDLVPVMTVGQGGLWQAAAI